MRYEVNVTEGQTWVYVRVHDPVTKALALDLLNDAVRLATKRRVGNLLIDARGAPSTKTSVEDYDIAYHCLQQLGFKRCSRTALIVDGEGVHRSWVRGTVRLRQPARRRVGIRPPLHDSAEALVHLFAVVGMDELGEIPADGGR